MSKTRAGSGQIKQNLVFQGDTGIVIPTGTTAQRNGTPQAGEIRYNTDLDVFEGYNGTTWGSMGPYPFVNVEYFTGDGSTVEFELSATVDDSKNVIVTMNGVTLTAEVDFDLSYPNRVRFIDLDGSTVNPPPDGAELTVRYFSPVTAAMIPAGSITAQELSTSGTNGQVLSLDNSGNLQFITIPTQDPTLGGDLQGTASNAQIKANSVGINELNVSDGIMGQVLATDGSGNLSFITVTSNNLNLMSVASDIIPDTTLAYDLGKPDKRFRDLYLSGTTINLGGTSLSVVGGELKLSGVKIPTQNEITQEINTTVAQAVVDVVAGSYDLTPYALISSLSAVAFNGSYNSLTNKPALFSGAYADLTGKPTLFSGSYNDLTSKPTLFSGSYNDLTNKPTLFSGSYNDLTNKPTLFSGAYADLTGKPSFATVATSGSYTDLTSKPTLFSGAYADLTGKPSLFSGSYNDLTSKPSLSTVATSGSYTDLSNKPSFATVATSGSYNDLSNKPSIPSLSGYATESYVSSAISTLVDGAPSALDTLNELSAALNDDSNFATTVTNLISGKADSTDPTITGSVTVTGALTPFGITSFTHDPILEAMSVNGEGMFWKPDGTRVYVHITNPGNAIAEYICSEAWNLSTAMGGFFLDYSGLKNALTGGSMIGMRTAFYIKPDGTEIYLMGNDGGNLSDYVFYTLTLTSAWNISSATIAKTSGTIISTPPTGFTFKADGDKVFVNAGGTTYQYNIGTSWDLSTISTPAAGSFSQSTYLPGSSYGCGIAFNDTGSKIYYVNTNGGIWSFNLATPYAIASTVSSSLTSFDLVTISTFGYASNGTVQWSSDGTKLFIGGKDGTFNSFIWRYDVAPSLGAVSTGSLTATNISVNGTASIAGNDHRLVVTSTQTVDPGGYYATAPVELSPTAYGGNYAAVNIAPPTGQVRIATPNGRLTLDCEVAWGISDRQFAIYGYGQIIFDSSVSSYRGTMSKFALNDIEFTNTSDVLHTKTSAASVVTHDFSTGSVWYHSSISANFTANFTNVPTTDNRTIVCTLILSQGSTAYIPNVVQIADVTQTIKWLGGVTPTGNANKVDIVSFTLIRTGSAWTVLGSLSTYG